MNENRDRSQWRRENQQRPEQADILRWQLALSDIAATYGEGKYKSMTPIQFRDPERDRMINLDATHFLVWATLCNLAKDLSKEATNLWHSYGEIAHHSGLNQKQVERALHDLETSVRIVATNHRGHKQTNETWIFSTPLAADETWQMRTGKKATTVRPASAEGTKVYVEAEVVEVGQAFADAFGQIACFQDQKTTDAFVRAIPRLIQQAGSAARLINLFELIRGDTTHEGLGIKAAMQKVTSPVEYLRKPLTELFRRYEPYGDANEQQNNSDDMGQPFEEEYQRNPFFVAPVAKAAAPPPPKPVAVVHKPSPQPIQQPVKAEPSPPQPIPEPVKAVTPPPKLQPPPPPVVEARLPIPTPIPIREQTIQVTERQAENTLRSLNYCFDDPKCFASEQYFSLRLPQMAALVGRDPERVRALFVAMNDDQSERLAAEGQLPFPTPVVRFGALLQYVEKADDAYRILLERIPGWHMQYKDKVDALVSRWAESAKARTEKTKAKAS